MKISSLLLATLAVFFGTATTAAVGLWAQPRNIKDTRITYLWDVTLSMKGFNGAPNIYDEVVQALAEDIDAISDPRTEIVVIPFQDTEFCEVWRAVATGDGKKDIIGKIRKYNNVDTTNTSIAKPLSYAIDNIFSPDKVDIMKLLTDGKDNVSPEEVASILDNWCEIAGKKDVYGYYVMLTDQAKDGDLVMKLTKVCRFEAIDDMGFQNIVSVFPPEKISLNIKDDYGKPVTFTLSTVNDAEIPEGFKIHVESLEAATEDGYPYIHIDETVAAGPDNTVTVHPEFLLPVEEMRSRLPKETNETIILSVTPAEGMDSGEYALTRIPDKECTLELVNKPEKSLRFYVK